MAGGPWCCVDYPGHYRSDAISPGGESFRSEMKPMPPQLSISQKRKENLWTVNSSEQGRTLLSLEPPNTSFTETQGAPGHFEDPETQRG